MSKIVENNSSKNYSTMTIDVVGRNGKNVKVIMNNKYTNSDMFSGTFREITDEIKKRKFSYEEYPEFKVFDDYNNPFCLDVGHCKKSLERFKESCENICEVYLGEISMYYVKYASNVYVVFVVDYKVDEIFRL
jgi:hypothetical protein